MWVRVFIATLLAVLASAPALAAPLSAYGKLPAIEGAEISPDGQKLAVIVTDGEERTVQIHSLADGKSVGIKAGSTKVRDIIWAGSDHLLIITSVSGDVAFVQSARREWMMGIDYDLVHRKQHPLLQDAKASITTIVGTPMIRRLSGKAYVFVAAPHFVDSVGRNSLFRIDLDTNKTTLVDQGFANTRDWVVGNDGKPIGESEYDQKTGLWTLRTGGPLHWKYAHRENVLLETPHLVGLGRDGASVLVADWDGATTALREVTPENADWPEPFHRGGYDRMMFDPSDHSLIGYQRLAGDRQQYEFLRPSDAATWAKVERAYKGQSVSLVSWSDDRQKMVLVVDTPKDGPSYALVDFNTHRADTIGALYPGVAAGDIAAKRAIHVKASDGLDLAGFLTLPNGAQSKGLPLIVLPHGGPASRDQPGFDWWSQALANRGYAVLQVNFRGSSGYGEKFLGAGYGQWGRKMQTDLSDGVRDLVAQGVVDPKRVCIVGASYGGYAALAGAAFDPGVYRCAASVAGPSDLTRMVAWTKDNKGLESQRYWTRFMGASGPKDPILRQLSPAFAADRITIPILLVHGKDDTVVALEQTQIMERALKAAGKPVETVIMPGEDHWLSRGETRLRMLESVVTFLEKYNPPGPGKSASN